MYSQQFLALSTFFFEILQFFYFGGAHGVTPQGAPMGSPLKMFSQFLNKNVQTIGASFGSMSVTTVGEQSLKYML